MGDHNRRCRGSFPIAKAASSEDAGQARETNGFCCQRVQDGLNHVRLRPSTPFPLNNQAIVRGAKASWSARLPATVTVRCWVVAAIRGMLVTMRAASGAPARIWAGISSYGRTNRARLPIRVSVLSVLVTSRTVNLRRTSPC